MLKDEIFRIAMSMNKIALALDETTYELIKPYLDEIRVVLENAKELEDGQMG